MAVRDSKTEWLRVQIYRNMTPEQRIMIAAQLYEDGLKTVRSSILDRRPDIPPEELERQVRRRFLPRHLFQEVEAALAKRGKMMQKDVLLKVLDALDHQHILYMIVGSFASNYWGRPRNTHDADLVVEIPPISATGLAKLLESEFYAPDFVIQEAAERGDHFNVIHFQTGFKVDFWVRKNTPYEQVCFQRRFQGSMFGRSLWLTSAEDIILSKLAWYKGSPVLDRQLQDVLEVYEIQEDELDQTYLNHWAATLGVAELLDKIREQVAHPPKP